LFQYVLWFLPKKWCRKVDCGRIITKKSTEVKKKSTAVGFFI